MIITTGVLAFCIVREVSKKFKPYIQKIKDLCFPVPPPDVYIDFNVFYDQYNLPSTHTYDSNLKYKVKVGKKSELLEAVTDAINVDYHKLYNIIESGNDIQQGIKFSRLFDDFQRLSKRGDRDIRLLKNSIILKRPMTRDFKIATIIDPSSPISTEDAEIDTTQPAVIRGIADAKVYPNQPASLDVPHRSSRVAYCTLGQLGSDPYVKQSRVPQFHLPQSQMQQINLNL